MSTGLLDRVHARRAKTMCQGAHSEVNCLVNCLVAMLIFIIFLCHLFLSSLCLRFSITLPFSLSMPPAIQASSTVAGAVGTETTETVRHKYGDDAAAVQ